MTILMELNLKKEFEDIHSTLNPSLETSKQTEIINNLNLILSKYEKNINKLKEIATKIEKRDTEKHNISKIKTSITNFEQNLQNKKIEHTKLNRIHKLRTKPSKP